MSKLSAYVRRIILLESKKLSGEEFLAATEALLAGSPEEQLALALTLRERRGDVALDTLIEKYKKNGVWDKQLLRTVL